LNSGCPDCKGVLTTQPQHRELLNAVRTSNVTSEMYTVSCTIAVSRGELSDSTNGKEILKITVNSVNSLLKVM
jgi:hypothetical protein